MRMPATKAKMMTRRIFLSMKARSSSLLTISALFSTALFLLLLILHSLGHPDKLGGWQSTGRSLSEKLLDWYAQCRHQARGEDRLPTIDAQGLVTVAFQHQHLNG